MAIYPAPNNGTPPPTDDQPFDKILATANTAMSLIEVPAGEVGRSFSIRNEGPGTAYVEIDGNATVTSTKILVGESYVQDGLAIASKISFIGEPGKKPRCSGVLWCGQ